MRRSDGFRHDLMTRAVKVLDVVLLTLPYAVCWYAVYADKISAPFYARGNYLVIAMFAMMYLVFGRIYDAFCISINPVSEMVYSQSLAALMANGVMYFITWLLSKHLPNVLPLILAFVVQIGLAALWSVWARRWYFRKWSAKKTVLIYDQREDMDQLLDEPNMRRKFEIVQKVSVAQALSGEFPDLAQADAVFLCGVHSHERNLLLKECLAADVDTYITPRIGDILMRSAHPIHMLHLPILRTGRCRPQPEYLFVKRLMDILFSAVGLLLTSSLFLITAIAIKATDGGPILYKQKRLTKEGRVFEVIKFRSMRVDAEKDGVARLSTGDKDDRVTKVGRVIRRFRIDELPQLWNVFCGEMSLVGPRPERPEIAAQYKETLPEFDLRLQVKAGLTGYAQVYGKYNTPPYEKLQMDLLYISHPSIAEDVRILLATVKILFTVESTEGVTTNAVSADNVLQAPTENEQLAKSFGVVKVPEANKNPTKETLVATVVMSDVPTGEAVG